MTAVSPPRVEGAPGSGPHARGHALLAIGRWAAWGRAAGARVRRLPGSVLVLVAYGLARLLDFALITRTATFQAPNQWTHPIPTYLDLTGMWDGDWYRIIAEQGYPRVVPRDLLTGHAVQNPWAFYPGYPYLVRGVRWVTGAGWDLAGSLTSLVLGAVAVLLLYLLLRRFGRWVAVGGAVLLATFPSSPVLQTTYSESLSLVLLLLAFLALTARRYWWCMPAVVLLGLTRPVALAFAAVVAVHLLVRAWRRGRDWPFPARQVGSGVLLLVVSVAAGLAWPVVASVVTKDPRAYLDTMASWRTGAQVHLFTPWIDISRWLLGSWGGPVTLVALVLTLLVVGTSQAVARLGPELQAWTMLYPAYLFAVVDPSTSLARYLLLLFPLGAAVLLASRSRAFIASLIVAFVAGQIIWIVWLLQFTPPTDWPP